MGVDATHAVGQDGVGRPGGAASPALKDYLSNEQRPWSRSTAASPTPRWGISSLPTTPSPTPYSASTSPLPFYVAGPGDSYRIPNAGRTTTPSGCSQPHSRNREARWWCRASVPERRRAGTTNQPDMSGRPEDVLRPARPGTALGTSSHTAATEQAASPPPARPATSLGLTAGLDDRIAISYQATRQDVRTPDGRSRQRAIVDAEDQPARPATALGVTSPATANLGAEGRQTFSTPASPSWSPPDSRAASPPAALLQRASPSLRATPELPREPPMQGHPWAGSEWLSSPPPWEEQRRAAPPQACVLADFTNRIMRPHGVWSTELWMKARAEVLSESVKLQGGQQEGFARLLALARHSTEEAIDRGEYKIPSALGARPRPIDLAHHMEGHPKALWYGMANTEMPEQPAGMFHHASMIQNGQVIPPPLLICDASPLDIALNLQNKAGPKQPVVLVVEIIDFNDAGGVDLRSSTCVAPGDFLLRTDFKRYLEAATSELRYATVPKLRDHFKDKCDPFMLYCPEVTVFRGPAEQGYPYLEEPMKLNVIAYALHNSKPPVQMVMRRKYGATEWYVDQSDHGTLLERLNIIGMVAQNTAKEVAPAPPMLIMVAPGCCGPARQPRDALANSLKHWRRVFAQFFHSVFVCCRGRGGGDEVLTSYLDSIVNKQVYRMCGVETLMSTFNGWNFELDELERAIDVKEIKKAGRKVKKGLMAGSGKSSPMDDGVSSPPEDEEPFFLTDEPAAQEEQSSKTQGHARSSMHRATVMPMAFKQSMHRATVVANLVTGQEDFGSSSSSDEDDEHVPASTTIRHELVPGKYEFTRSNKVNEMMNVYDVEISMGDAFMGLGRGPSPGAGRAATPTEKTGSRSQTPTSRPGSVTPTPGSTTAPGKPVNRKDSRGIVHTASPGYFAEHYQSSLNKLHGKFKIKGPQPQVKKADKAEKKKKKEKRKSKNPDDSQPPTQERFDSNHSSFLERITERDEQRETFDSAKGKDKQTPADTSETRQKSGARSASPPSSPKGARPSSAKSAKSGSPRSPGRPRRGSLSTSPHNKRSSISRAEFSPEVWRKFRRKSCEIEARGNLCSYEWDNEVHSKMEQLRQLQTLELFDVKRPRSAGIRSSSKERSMDGDRPATEGDLLDSMRKAEKKRGENSLSEMVGGDFNIMTSRPAGHAGLRRKSVDQIKNPQDERVEVRDGRAHTVSAAGLEIRAEMRRRLSQRKTSVSRQNSYGSNETAGQISPDRFLSHQSQQSRPDSAGGRWSQSGSRPGSARAGSRPGSGRRFSSRLVSAAHQPFSPSKDSDDGDEHIFEDNEVMRNNTRGSRAMEFTHAATAPARPMHRTFDPPAICTEAPSDRPESSMGHTSQDTNANTPSRPEAKQLLTPQRPSTRGSKSPRGSKLIAPDGSHTPRGSMILHMAMRHATAGTTHTPTGTPRTPSKSSGTRKNADVLEENLHHMAENIEGNLEKKRLLYKTSASPASSQRPSIAPP